MTPPLSKISVHLSITLRSCRTVDRPLRNPNCLSDSIELSLIYARIASLIIDSRILQAMLVRLIGLKCSEQCLLPMLRPCTYSLLALSYRNKF